MPSKENPEPTSPLPDNKLSLIAYCVRPARQMSIVPAPRSRQWMDDTSAHFANRCLPLLIANQSGWLVLNRCRVEAMWDGREGADAITVSASDPENSGVSSHFGYGVLTWSIPYLFRTPPGYNLLVRGPANMPKDGIGPLDGVVETDWAEAVFTMNWKFTRANSPVVFEAGEPICMIVPQFRTSLEQFQPVIRSIDSAPDEKAGVLAWSKSREQFIEDRESGYHKTANEAWQKHYVRGSTVRGTEAEGHQSRLNLAEFADELNGSPGE